MTNIQNSIMKTAANLAAAVGLSLASMGNPLTPVLRWLNQIAILSTQATPAVPGPLAGPALKGLPGSVSSTPTHGSEKTNNEFNPDSSSPLESWIPAFAGMTKIKNPQLRSEINSTAESGFNSAASDNSLPTPAPAAKISLISEGRGHAQWTANSFSPNKFPASGQYASLPAAQDRLGKQFDGLLKSNYALASFNNAGKKAKPAIVWRTRAEFEEDASDLRYYKKDGDWWAEVSDPSEVPALQDAGVQISAFLGDRDDPDSVQVHFGRKAALDDLTEFSKASARQRRLGEFYRPLGDDSILNETLGDKNTERRLGAELASYNTLSAAIAGDPNAGDPVLRDETKALDEATNKVAETIQNYRQAVDNEQDMREIYQLAREIAKSEKAVDSVAKANTELITTLLLKRGYMFLDLAIQKINEIQKDVIKQKDRNADDTGELAGKKAEALRRLGVAQDYLSRSRAGEFVKIVDDDVKKIQDAIAKANKDIAAMDSVENLLNDGWGNLAGTFLDPKVVDQEIADWSELREQFRQSHDKVFKFLDPQRSATEREPDEFGDTHFKSAHLWTEELISSLKKAEAGIRLGMDEFQKIKKIRECLKTNPDCFYIGVKGDPELQPTKEQKEQLLTRREGFSLLVFADAVIRYKIAESTLNALLMAYKKDPSMGNIPLPEPYYQNTLSRMEEGRALGQSLMGQAKQGFNMERELLVQNLKIMTDGELNDLVAMIEDQYQSASPAGYAHHAYGAIQRALDVADDTLEFYQKKRDFLNSGPDFFQILKSSTMNQQSEISHQQLDMAKNTLLPFLKDWRRPAEAARTDTYEGFVALYDKGYGQLYEAEETFYKTEAEGLDSLDKFIQDLVAPFIKDFERISQWLAALNPKEDPAIRRLGRSLSDAGDEMLRQLRSKKFMIYAIEDSQKQREKLKQTLENLRIQRERLTQILERADPEDPNFAKARELVLQGELLYSPEGLDSESQLNQNAGPLFIRKNTVNRVLSQGASTGSQPPSVNDWVGSLGLNDYEVIPVGSGADSFYVVVHFVAGTAIGSAEQAANNYSHDALLKFGNLGQVLGHNMSLSLYDWKDTESPSRGHRGARIGFHRDRDDEKIINSTVIDIHQNLQQGNIFRAMIFENMAFMVLGDRLFIGLTGFADMPINQGDPQDQPPYTAGGRAKAVIYLHEVVSLNAELLGVFAKDPYDFTRTINTSIDPLAMNEQSLSIQGAILQYIKRHAGVEFDLAKIFSTKNTFAIEFFLEDEKAKETNPGEVSDRYRAEAMDDYDKTWKGAKLVKEIHFTMFGERTSIMGETRVAWDQNGEIEPSARLALYLPRGITIEGKGARYGGKYTGKGSLDVSIGAGTDIFASYGNDRIESIPKLMIGVKSAITIEELRRKAVNSAEAALKGGDTLEDFRSELDHVFALTGSKEGPAMRAALGRALYKDSGLVEISQAIGQKEQDAVELQRVLIGGLAAQAGVILGTGYENAQTGESQNAPGYSSTAGGIQVGAEVFVGLKKEQKEKALREIARIKILLLDLKRAYQEALDAFRAGVLRVVLARLDVKKIEQLKARSEISSNPTLSSRIELEEMRLRGVQAQAEAMLRERIGLDKNEALPKELEAIVIDPDNPQAALDAAARAVEQPDGWKKLLESISGVDPKKTARPGWPESWLATLSPLQILPWVDEVSVNFGVNIWDSLGNAFAGVGASVKLTMYDADGSHQKEVAILQGKIADLDVTERLLGEQANQHPKSLRFDRWALERERMVIDMYLGQLKANLDQTTDLSGRLKILDQVSRANKEFGRINLELLALAPDPSQVKSSTNTYSLNSFSRLVLDAETKSTTLAKLAMQRQVAKGMEEAAKSRVSVGLRLGARWNPVANLFPISSTEFFTVDGWAFLLPQLEIAIKSSGQSQVEEREAKAIAAASVADHDLQNLDLRRQIVGIYLKLVYAESIKQELLRKIEATEDPGQIARWNIEILELRKAMQYESVRLIVLLGKDPSQYELDVTALLVKNPLKETEALRGWTQANLSRAKALERRALETRLELVRAMEGKLLFKGRLMNIKSEPISALFQVIGDIVSSLFGEEGGASVSQADLVDIMRYRSHLERQIQNWDKRSGIDQSRATVGLGQRDRALSKDPSLSNRLSRELAWASSVAQGFQGRENPDNLPDANERRRAPLLKWGARVYLTNEAVPTPETLHNKTKFFDPNAKKGAVFYEGMIQVLLSQPELINPRMLAKAEELELARELRVERMESDLKQARLSGLLWKHRYFTGKLANATDPDIRQRLETQIKETQETIKAEFNLAPDQYPKTQPSLSPVSSTDVGVLVQTALKFVVGEAPVLGALQADLALGRLQGQTIVDNLRYQSMSPSFVLGYIRNGLIGGPTLSAPMAGRVPGADLFRDIERVMGANIASVLKASSMVAEIHERLIKNYFEMGYLQEELARREVFLTHLKSELERDSGNGDLVESYHNAFEETLTTTARLHDLYLQIETDLKLMGINIPRGLGRSARDPWALERRVHALGLGEAMALARETNPAMVAGWGNLTPKDKAKRLDGWKTILSAKLAGLSDEAKNRVTTLAKNMQKDASLRPRRDNRPAGILVALDSESQPVEQNARAVSSDEMDELKVQGRVISYDA
ncbi:MAG: hypothetical protein AAB091_08005, partial [Elusimicrobiota bacterium]